MKKQFALYNPHANNGKGAEEVKALSALLKDVELTFVDMTAIEAYSSFFSQLTADTDIIICGGDGTLNRFINDTAEIDIPNSIYYYAIGSGNDFWHDLGKKRGDAPVCIDEYIRNLPRVYVNGSEHYFINGIGYGIDGYCCEVGDIQRASSDKPVNYSLIAIKGLLFHFKPRCATVTVDGTEYDFKKVWIAPAMNGRFYGGGMMPTPNQDRLRTDGKLSVGMFFGSGKLKTLMIFPSLFKGKHVSYTKNVKVLEGHEVTVRFDRPTALQIDGETVLGVTEYRAVGRRAVAAKADDAQCAARV